MSSPARRLPREDEIDWSRPVRMTFEQFLDFEERSEEKHEYVDGRVIPLSRLIADSGGSLEHSTVIANLVGEVRNKLIGTPCRVLESNMAVKRRGHRKYRYPDLSVVCGTPELDPNVSGRRALNNPAVLFEVLSSTTAETDRTEKQEEYAAFESFRAYVQVESTRPWVHVFSRTDDGGWGLDRVKDPDGTVRLPGLDVELSMREIYRDVEFPDG